VGFGSPLYLYFNKNIGHIISENTFMMCPTFYLSFCGAFFKKRPASFYLLASSIATATATVIPTMGLLPAPISFLAKHRFFV